MFKWRVQTPPPQRRAAASLSLPVEPDQGGGSIQSGSDSPQTGAVPNLDTSHLFSPVAESTDEQSCSFSMESFSSLKAHASEVDLENKMDAVAGYRRNLVDDGDDDDGGSSLNTTTDTGYLVDGFKRGGEPYRKETEDVFNTSTILDECDNYGVGYDTFSDVYGDCDLTQDIDDVSNDGGDDDDDDEESSPMLPTPAPRKLLTRCARIDEDDGYGDSFECSLKTECNEDESEKERLLRSSSLPRLQDEEEDANSQDQTDTNSHQLSPQNGAAPHPGHRFYTPQPSKRKALKPQTSTRSSLSSKPPVLQKPQTPPVPESGSQSKPQRLTLKIPKPTGTFGNNALDSGVRSASFGESFDSVGSGSASAGVNAGSKRALKPPSAQPRPSPQKQPSVTSTPSTPGSSVFTPDGLRITPEYADEEPIQPRRKAPTKPPVGRRKSDPLSNSRIKRRAAENDENYLDNVLDNTVAASGKKKLTRNRTLEDGLSPSDLSQYAGSRHRYFTPQPSRRKFSFRDGQGKKISGNNSPAASPQHLLHTRSPVERLANQMRSIKHQSAETLSPESASVTSPVRTARTLPSKPALLPPNQGSKSKSYHFVTDEEVNDAHKHVGGTRRARSLSSGAMQAMKRRPLPSTPGRPRSGSASKSTPDHIPTVSQKAIQRKRRNRQSAPAGRVASLLTDSNSSLHKSATLPADESADQVGGDGRKRDTLREELLRSMLVDNVSKRNSATLPITYAGDVGVGVDGEKAHSLQDVENSLKIDMVRQKSGYDDTDSAPRYSPLAEKNMSYSSSGMSPSPPSSAGNSPTRQHPRRRRNKSSLSSLVSMPKSLLASNEFLSDILLSERGSHKKLKAIVGFLVGLILGALLFLGLRYGLAYPLYPALIIAAVGTTFMALCLAFTVRARCVAALMVPTICTSRGRAAFLTFIVTLLLRGPIHNIYINANEVSDSMSCSAQLAYNQSREIQLAAQRVFDAYVGGLLSGVNRIEDAVQQVQEVFEPFEVGLDALNNGLDGVGKALVRAGEACDDIFGSAYRSCSSNLNTVYHDCREFMQNNRAPNSIAQVCNMFNADTVCRLLQMNKVCETPRTLDGHINNALDNTRTAMQGVVDAFAVDVDFTRYFEKRQNSSTTAEDIQQAIAQELDEAYSYLDWVLAISDKLLALSFAWLCFRSYLYHSSYRTKDRFDNQYVTAQFKKLDASRKERELPHILPLKKSEKNRLIDVTSIRLNKAERGFFKFGLATVFLHSIIAGLLMFIDFGLYWLLSKIREHGQFQVDTSGEAATDVEFEGKGIVAELVRILFDEGFKASSAFNTSLDTSICLPQPAKPNDKLAIGISVLYVVTIIMVLSQAYAMRLLRYIAAYYYPEREVERIAYLYGRTLQKRQTLMRMIREAVKRNKKEKDAHSRISITSYLSLKYPCCKSLFSVCGVEQTQCLGCSSPDDGLLVYCSDRSCDGAYCEECAHALQGKCSICEDTINMGKLAPPEAEHKL